jgi:nucleoside-diphosphate-sugar epimerase
MSSGLQLREYWHVSDVVKYLLSRIEQASTTGITRVTSGKPIQLRELARQIFDHFDLRELLAINALATSPHENYGRLFLPEDADIAHFMRDPIPGVIAFLEDLVKGESDGQSE